MQYRSPVQNHSILNLTPLIDIVFLLLVFFMLTAHFVEEQKLDLSLPVAETGETLSDISIHKISINPTGIFLLDGEPVHANVLAYRLEDMKSQNQEIAIQLEADKDTPFEKVVLVLDVARKLQMTNLEILTEQP